MAPPLVRRLVLTNYKSIAGCKIDLGPLTFLVGPNGAGKSNIVDALRLTSESLRTSLDHALRERGGISEVRRRSVGHPTHFGIRIEFILPSGRVGHYAFRVGAMERGRYRVQQEECVVFSGATLAERAWYRVTNGAVTMSVDLEPPVVSVDRLYLVTVSGLPQFREVFDSLSRMGFYNLNPQALKDLQSPDPGEILDRDGDNIASVWANLDHARQRDVEQALSQVVPGVKGVERREIGPKETIEFRQSAGARDPWRFLAASMSDGTLRTFGILVALFQGVDHGSVPVPLVAVEEPETALHPAAAGVLLDALQAASKSTQVIVTSHSPELLDNKDIDPNSILAVLAVNGKTTIGPLDAVGRRTLEQHLYTPGELLRLDQIRPDEQAANPPVSQLRLFGE